MKTNDYKNDSEMHYVARKITQKTTLSVQFFHVITVQGFDKIVQRKCALISERLRFVRFGLMRSSRAIVVLVTRLFHKMS